MVITTDNYRVFGFNKNELMGLIILFVGIGLQLLVFFLAIHTIFNPEISYGFSNAIETQGVIIGKLLRTLSIFISAFLLVVMSILSGMIGKYGVKLSRHRSPDGLGDE